MNKISIVIPIYNVEKYLPQCLDSVINQTHPNLEIILVNDGSTDSCGEIGEGYAAKDPRIKVIHKENGGLSDARNAGIKVATGEYIAFIDSDDWIVPNFCDSLLQTALQKKAEIVECGFSKFQNESEINVKRIDSQNTILVYDTEEALKLLMKETIKQMACNKLFKKDIIEGVLFENNRKHEDEFWTYQIIGNAKRIVKTNDILYFYRQHSQSIMGRNYNVSRLDGLLALEKRIQYMAEKFPDSKDLAVKIFCFASIYHYQKLASNSEIDFNKKHRKEILTNIKKYLPPNSYKMWSIKEIFWINFFMFAPQYCAQLRNELKIGI